MGSGAAVLWYGWRLLRGAGVVASISGFKSPLNANAPTAMAAQAAAAAMPTDFLLSFIGWGFVSVCALSAELVIKALLSIFCRIASRFSDLGSDYNGVLSAAYKIPNLVSTVYLMFGQAWNMSAITEDDSDDRDSFYENVFDFNQSLLYILVAGSLWCLCR